MIELGHDELKYHNYNVEGSVVILVARVALVIMVLEVVEESVVVLVALVTVVTMVLDVVEESVVVLVARVALVRPGKLHS